MTYILISSALIGIMPAVTIWTLWKLLEYKAWIEPAIIEAMMTATAAFLKSLKEATDALRHFGLTMSEANEAIKKMKITKA